MKKDMKKQLEKQIVLILKGNNDNELKLKIS